MPEVEISESERLEEYRNSFSDYHKEVYGFRPRYDVSHYTLEVWEKVYASLSSMLADNMAYEKEAEAAAIADLEKRIGKLMEMGAKNRAAALRWIADAEGAEADSSYLEYLLGLPYGYLRPFV